MGPKFEAKRVAWIERNARSVGVAYGTNADDRDDYAQEAAVKAVLTWKRNPAADPAYVVRAMHNAVISLLRKRKVRRAVLNTVPMDVPLASEDEGLGDGVWGTSEEPSPQEVVEQGEELAAALAILDQLAIDQRQVFVASETVGMHEFIRRTGMPKNRAYKLLRAARQAVSGLRQSEPQTVHHFLAL